MKAVSDVYLDFLQKFNEADSLCDSLSQRIINGVDSLSDEEWESLNSQMDEAKRVREHYAVVLCRVLSDYHFFDVDVSEVAQADASADALEDAPADVPEDAPADVSEDAPADVSEDAPVQSAKCKICPSCVDGRCFFVPDQYDSDFPCLSPAWDDFFRGGSRSPAPSARASPLQ